MKVKTITAPSIHAALMEARRHLGDDVVLLESIAASDDGPARITVMADERSDVAASKSESTSVPARRSAPAPKRRTPAPAYGYQAQKKDDGVAVLAEESAQGRERLSGSDQPSYVSNVGRQTLRDLVDDGDEDVPVPQPRRRGVSGPTGRGQIFPNQGELIRQTPANLQTASIDSVEQLLKAQLNLLHERLDKLERRFDGAIIGAGHSWTSHPLFTSLLKQGFRPATVTRLFDSLASRGYESSADAEALQWAMAQEIRRSIDLTAPKQTSGAQVFIGPSGAGKTSLLLKLAKHAGFYGRRQTAAIIIEPEDTDEKFHNSPVDLFRREGLPVQVVQSIDDMQQAIKRVQHFDHILIDTPPMPTQTNAAAKLTRYVKRLVDPIMPLRVEFVFNATRSLDDFDPAFIRSLPLRPEALALTHLDETQGWGRIAEWLMTLKMPVQFMSTSSAVPDGVSAFSPTWFVEEMMKL